MGSNVTNIESKTESVFDGGLLGLIGTGIVAALMCIIPFIGVPMSVCYQQRWYARHTVIEGKRHKFVGTWSALFGKYIIWMLLTIVTIGIYSFWLNLRMHQWVVANTVFDNE